MWFFSAIFCVFVCVFVLSFIFILREGEGGELGEVFREMRCAC